MKEQKDRYKIFFKACEMGSFSKAAEALNYTQSGISRMMAGLEEELDFSKTTNSVVSQTMLRYLQETIR